MKRYLLTIILTVFIILGVIGQVLAAGSWTTNATIADRGKFRYMSWTFTADSSAATIPAKTPTASEYKLIQQYPLLCFVATDPGATGPTNGAWDVTLVGATSAMTDITGGAAANLSSSVGQVYAVKDSGGNMSCVPIVENFAITITGNAVNSAVGTVTLIFYKP